ncbi:MAG: hypothetical protein V2I27_09455 [Erythrobacter sp.]|jgi:hypothetical protein|nr:hypothetical protein [Erythrobacter sp.]
MTRLFFAFFALLSGLCAMQVPAHAARHEQSAYGVQSAAQAASHQDNQLCPAARRADDLPQLRDTEAGHPRELRAELRVPCVVVGVDKSLE